jgi:hypothetical protein
VVIWAYSSILEGQSPLTGAFIIRLTHSEGAVHGQSKSKVLVESSLARRAATDYLDRLLSCPHPFALPEVKDKNRCAAIVAYTSYLAGTLGRGIMDESRNVLEGLLTEHL